MVQSQGFADVNMGIGIMTNGLAALMIGEAVVGKRTLTRQLLAPLRGHIALLSIAVGLPRRRTAAGRPQDCIGPLCASDVCRAYPAHTNERVAAAGSHTGVE